MPNNVQVILNASDFVGAREVNAGGSHKDFFAYNDDEFKVHKSSISNQVRTVRERVATQNVDVGYVKVTMRHSALAKSHRPVNAVLNPQRTPIVGGNDVGEIVAQVTKTSLDRMLVEIGKAEEVTRTRTDKNERAVPNPSVQRSEVGAISRIDLIGPSDKLNFDAADAIEKLSDPRRGGAYYVDLFETIPLRSEWDALPNNIQSLLRSFEEALRGFGSGIVVERLDQTDRRNAFLSVILTKSDEPPVLPFTVGAITTNPPRHQEPPVTDLRIERHRELLKVLSQHPLVRRIRIAPKLARSAPPAAIRTAPRTVGLHLPKSGIDYPTIGVIDGGIDAVLDPWVVHRWDFLQSTDRDVRHGTFIAGLLVHGAQLNGTDICGEADGAHLADIDVFPDENDVNAFIRYYPKGAKDFFEELEQAILWYRANRGVRIFNLSINADAEALLERYSYEARKLDAIADEADVIIVVSAGNLDAFPRPEWDQDHVTALGDIAAARNDTIQIPAESSRNVSVASLNPPGVRHAVADAPASYSRRGPGLRAGVKPDCCHYGGALMKTPITSTGIFSLGPGGTIVEQCGTSYAAPLTAKSLAATDTKLGGQASRETLLALLAHHAKIEAPLNHRTFSQVARHLVGFGKPATSEEMLTCADHQITMVFAARLLPDQIKRFPFSWPKSLVVEEGKCRGRARMTIAYTPPLNYNFGAEFARINLGVRLQQEDPENATWSGGKMKQSFLPRAGTPEFATESDLISDGLKWSPIKVYTLDMKQGAGRSSNWRIEVNYLTRALAAMPQKGVPFTLILTIEDYEGEKPVFNEMRLGLQSMGATLSDIRTASRISPRT